MIWMSSVYLETIIDGIGRVCTKALVAIMSLSQGDSQNRELRW